MEPLTYESLQRDPELLEKLLRDARRERALAMGQFFAAVINSLRRLSQRQQVTNFVRKLTASRPLAPSAFVRPHSRFASKG